MIAVLRPIAAERGKLVAARRRPTRHGQQRPSVCPGTDGAERPVRMRAPGRRRRRCRQPAPKAAATDADMMELDFDTERDMAATMPP